jgi:hypothetical protein
MHLATQDAHLLNCFIYFFLIIENLSNFFFSECSLATRKLSGPEKRQMVKPRKTEKIFELKK